MSFPSDPGQSVSASQELAVRAAQLLRRNIYRWGWGILLIGWISAALIYMLATPNGATGASIDVLGDRGYDYNIERIGGKAALYASRINYWLGSLWHGRALGWTIAVLALVLALVCFWVAELITEPVSDATETEIRH